MARVTRRKFLKVSGAGALAAKAGGMAGILAAGRAPAYAQATTVHWLRWNDFVPASDQLLRKEMLPEAEKALGIKINFETVNANDLQPRITVGDPVGRRPRHHHALQQPSAALRRRASSTCRDVAEDARQGPGRLLPAASRPISHDGKKWLVHAVGHRSAA